MNAMAFLILRDEVPQHRMNSSLMCTTYICIFFKMLLPCIRVEKMSNSCVHGEVLQQLCESF